MSPRRWYYRSCVWLLGPIRGVRRYTWTILETLRAVCTSSVIFTLMTTLQWAVGNLVMLPLTPTQSVRVSGALGTAIFVLHMIVQFFQASPSPLPSPPPAALVTPTGAPLGTHAEACPQGCVTIH